MTKYVKRIEVIEAIQWTGDNFEEVAEFVGDKPNESHRSSFRVIEDVNGKRAEISGREVRVGDYLLYSPEYLSYMPYRKASFEAAYTVPA